MGSLTGSHRDMSVFPMSGQRLYLATPMMLPLGKVILALGCLLKWSLPVIFYDTNLAMTNFVMIWLFESIGMTGTFKEPVT